MFSPTPPFGVDDPLWENLDPPLSVFLCIYDAIICCLTTFDFYDKIQYFIMNTEKNKTFIYFYIFYRLNNMSAQISIETQSP